MVRVISTAPHSGHGRGSDVGASLRGDEDIENVDPFSREDLALRVDVETIERQSLDHV